MAAQIRPDEQEETGGGSVLRVIDQATISNLLYSCKHSALEVEWSRSCTPI